MTTPYPTKLSDLYLPDTSTNPSIYTTLKHLKKATLSLHNRLRSILIDAAYITTTIAPSFPTFPLLANERCGSWYIPPSKKGGSAYFKSTDGHYGVWDFSLRRLNLVVLEVLGRDGGAVLIDSTRRGKRMPDALRRTVPVWVVVWNRVLFGELMGVEGWEWAFGLQHPGLEDGEVRLIEGKVDGWVEGLKRLGLDLAELKRKVGRPIRLCWVVHGEEVPESNGGTVRGEELQREAYNLLVLCSASRRVFGAEMSEDGYVQGAGDDAEGWSGGLTPKIFWEHKDELMATAEEELPDLIAKLIEKSRSAEGQVDAVQVRPTSNIFVAAAQDVTKVVSLACFDVRVDCNNKAVVASSASVNLGCRSGKLGSKDLRDKLPVAVNRVVEALKKNAESKILIVCENGKDLSIGVAVTLLCMLYNDEGQLQISQSKVPDKQLVKKRLAWITSAKADANPSRSTLQAVNSFLM